MEKFSIRDFSEYSEDDDASDPEPEPEPETEPRLELAGGPTQRIKEVVETIIASNKETRRLFQTRTEQSLGGSALSAVCLYRENDTLGRVASVRTYEALVGVTEDGDAMDRALVELAVVKDEQSEALQMVKYLSSEPEDRDGWVPVPDAEAEKVLGLLKAAPLPDKGAYTIGKFKRL